MKPIDDYVTFITIRVSIPSAVNTPERRYKDGSSLRKLVHKELSLPPLFVPGMYICFDGGGSEKVDDILWHSDQGILELFGHREILYWNQGPDNLEGQEKIISFFDGYIQSYLDAGWKLGNPPK